MKVRTCRMFRPSAWIALRELSVVLLVAAFIILALIQTDKLFTMMQ